MKGITKLQIDHDGLQEILQEYIDEKYPGLGKIDELDFDEGEVERTVTLTLSEDPNYFESGPFKPSRRKAEIISHPALNETPDEREERLLRRGLCPSCETPTQEGNGWATLCPQCGWHEGMVRADKLKAAETDAVVKAFEKAPPRRLEYDKEVALGGNLTVTRRKHTDDRT